MEPVQSREPNSGQGLLSKCCNSKKLLICDMVLIETISTVIAVILFKSAVSQYDPENKFWSYSLIILGMITTICMICTFPFVIMVVLLNDRRRKEQMNLIEASPAE